MEQLKSKIDKMEIPISLQMQQITLQQHGIDKMKSLINLQTQQQSCDASKELESVKDGCEGITGLTNLYINESPVTVPCDGAGWVAILRRVDNNFNFHTNGWADYKHGFGRLPIGSFWLGLEVIHRYTSLSSTKLRIELEDFDGVTSWAEYSYFHILGESNGYRLMVSGKRGNASDPFSNDSGMRFTTKDRDNDFSTGNCAKNKGPWWFYTCDHACLTEEYASNEAGINWGGAKKKVEIKIRLK